MLTLDGDGNGEVDFDEFLKVWENFPFQITDWPFGRFYKTQFEPKLNKNV